jgi:hypothetical protein
MLQMPENENDSLNAEIARLRAHLHDATAEISTLQGTIKRLNDRLSRFVKDICEIQGDAYERIKLLELKVFPGLVRDLSSVNKIVGLGDEPPGGDALDRRKP